MQIYIISFNSNADWEKKSHVFRPADEISLDKTSKLEIFYCITLFKPIMCLVGFSDFVF